MNFALNSTFKPTGDQPEAIANLITGINHGDKEQVLIGVTGSGKTFTVANVITDLNMPALVISHNKTLAGQLFQEFREFFPQNAVSYFVSYYDYYQPEAYIPQTDTYIEKETDINEEIDKLRLAATTNILTRKDIVVVASVSCIYNIGSPREYGKFVLELMTGMPIEREQIVSRLVDLMYSRAEYDFPRGSFRVRGTTVDVNLAYEDRALRISMNANGVASLNFIDPVSGTEFPDNDEPMKNYVVYPAKHYMADTKNLTHTFDQIRRDMLAQVKKFESEGKHLEAHRIKQRVNFDLEMLQEVGYVNGIENYSRYFDGRNPGDPPYTLIDYFREAYGNDWLLIIDESHMTVPQIHGMYNGDKARKQTLINFGFRLPASLDNRPLQFDEFTKLIPQTMYVSATPSSWELERANHVVEQLLRPTGLVDPDVEVRKIEGQIPDLTTEIIERHKNGERTLVTTLTKRTAEDLSNYLNKHNPDLRVAYLHSDIDTLDRQDILDDLRKGTYHVLVGINLLREGLDLPEVSLVAILDADKEGFLRSGTSLIQTMGRAARHEHGHVIMYADRMTPSMKLAIGEVRRRRAYQTAYNKKHGITPRTIQKPIRKQLIQRDKLKENEKKRKSGSLKIGDSPIDPESLTPQELKDYIAHVKKQMREAARNLDFERAAELRDYAEGLER